MGLRFDHDRVRQVRALLARRRERHDQRRFVVEGTVLVSEAVAAGWRSVAQFVPESRSDAVVPDAGEVFELASGVFERVASTKQPQPPVAIVEFAEHTMPSVLAAADFVVVLDRIADPGNLGTILRSAEAAGADAIVVTAGSVDPYNPKVVRASAGALFHVPVGVAEIDRVTETGLQVFGTTRWDEAGIGLICATASVATRSFYEEFDTREALLLEVATTIVLEGADRLQTALAEAPATLEDLSLIHN